MKSDQTAYGEKEERSIKLLCKELQKKCIENFVMKIVVIGRHASSIMQPAGSGSRATTSET